MRVAYLVNRYPAASHSFIRREIDAIELEGIAVTRFSVRAVDPNLLPDERDRAEHTKTQALLARGATRLLASGLWALVGSPIEGLRALRIAFAGCEWRPRELVRRSAYFFESALLARHIRRSSIAHIHAHFGTNSTAVARITSVLARVPYSFTVHGPDEFDSPQALDLAGKVRDCNFCVAISSFGRSQLMRWSAFADWDKIHVIRCGVDESFLDRDEVSAIPSTPHLCSVARLSAQKGIPILLEAAARLKRAGSIFKLTIIGDGEMRSGVEALIETLQLRDSVILTGLADSKTVKESIQQSRAMVLPSFAEGLPVVIMEALALGRPVIVSAIAGTPELVDAECGWLVPAGGVDQLVAAMQDALDAPTERLARMGEIGRVRVASNHNASKNGQELATLLRTAHSA